MDPGEYVYTADGSMMVMLRSGVDPRAARVWDIVLEQFLAMGMTIASAKAEAWWLQHDLKYHHSWAVELQLWCPGLAYYAKA
jgi:hypothetical protein